MSMSRPTDSGGVAISLTYEGEVALSLEDYARRGMETAYDGFVSTINDTLATLPAPRDIRVIRLRFGLEDGERYTLDSVRIGIGISRERVRQLQRIATQALRRNVAARPFRVLACASVLRTWGGLIGERLEDDRFSRALSQTIGVDKKMIDAHIRLLLDLEAVPPDERAPLDALDARIVDIFIQNIDPVSLDALKSEVMSDDEARRALRDWPNLDMSMRLRLILGVEIDDDGICVPTELTFAGSTKMDHRLNAMVSALREAGKPLHFSEIAKRAEPLLPGSLALSERNIHARLDRHKKHFRWAGMGMFALTDWDIGVREDNMGSALRPTRRKGIGDEIAMILLERGEPMRLQDIEDHILLVRKIEVIPRSIAASVATDKARRFTMLGGGWVGLTEWGDDVVPPSDPSPPPPRRRKRRYRKERASDQPRNPA